MVGNLTETLVIKSDVNELAKVASITEEICERFGLIEDEIDDISIAVTEAVNNAIKHGNKEDSSKSIEIVFEIETEKIKIRIRDEGEGVSCATWRLGGVSVRELSLCGWHQPLRLSLRINKHAVRPSSGIRVTFGCRYASLGMTQLLH